MSLLTLPPREPGVFDRTDVLERVADMSPEDVAQAIEHLDWDVTPWSCGPTWDKDPEWTGPRDPDGYILPHFILGWQAIKWARENLLADETDENDNPLPFTFTAEQMRFVLWFYALDPGDAFRDPSGVFQYREFVLQRLKGWGKDPLAAVISAIEFVGPCRFAGWAARDMPEKGLKRGDPVGKPHPRAWIQIAAVSLEQTQNTMKLFQGLFTDACMAEHGIDLGKETIYAYGGKKTIKAVTSSPKALEGNRPTLVIMNETHHWGLTNEGIAMADAIERNATKAKGGAARTLAITNAYEPSVDSVARQQREAYEEEASGLAYATGMCYDSLEAPKDARLRPRFPDEDALSDSQKETLTRRYLSRILEAVRGDAWWLDIPSLVNSILNRRNKASRSRRFWFNQIVASEDAWLDPAAITASISEMAVEARRLVTREGQAQLEAGWLVAPTEPVVMFFDGSKSDDSTALVGCRLEDGYTFTIGVWQRPPGKRGEKWLAPREAVDARVNDAFKRFNIVAFWGDPSHTKDDEDSTRYWDGYLDRWMQKYAKRSVDDKAPGRTLDPKFFPIKSGHRKHAVMFDMAGPDQQKLFIAAAEEFVEAMETLNDIEEFAPTFQIDGHPALIQHLNNAVRHPHPSGWGVSLMKESRESPKKIDLAVCAVGARMLRRVVLNSGVEEEKPKDNTIWGVGW